MAYSRSSTAANNFFRWKSRSDDNVFTHEELESEVRDLVEKMLKSRDYWVGILGLVRVGGWLLDSWRSRRGGGRRREEVEEGEGDGEGFKFGVFLMTTSPPMTELGMRKVGWGDSDSECQCSGEAG